MEKQDDEAGDAKEKGIAKERPKRVFGLGVTFSPMGLVPHTGIYCANFDDDPAASLP